MLPAARVAIQDVNHLGATRDLTVEVAEDAQFVSVQRLSPGGTAIVHGHNAHGAEIAFSLEKRVGARR